MLGRDSPVSDAELLAAHVAGDPHAFAELVGRHQHRLVRVARRHCSCPEDAADALQDALLAAHRGAPAFRYHSAVSSWLHRIVANACLDRLRHNRTRVAAALETVPHPTVDPTAPIATALVVRRALTQLSEAQRDAIVALDMHGYSVTEAAALLGVPEGTVKSRAARARARLAALLAA